MPKRLLNVEYYRTRTRIDITDLGDLSEVIRAIRTKYDHVMTDVGAAQLQLYNQQGQQIAGLDDIPKDYCKSLDDGGLSLVVRTSNIGSTSSKRQSMVIKDLTMKLKSFANAQLVEGCIQSQDQELLPYTLDKIKKLYVRSCYQDVFDLFMQKIGSGVESFAISGTSGIGKSLFFVYILYRLLNDWSTKTLPLRPNRIVYQSDSSCQCFDLQQQVVTQLSKLEAGRCVREQDTFYVIDGRTSEPLCMSCITLFISSPPSESYKNFVKQKKVKPWYFPVWTLEELETCRRHCYPDLPIEIIKEGHAVYGGVPHHIFDENYSADTMKEAFEDVDAVKSVKNIGIPTRILGNTHTLLHMVVSDDGQYKFAHVDIASKYVGEQLWIQHSAQMITTLQEMFGSIPTEISRHLFEIYGHMVLSVGGRTLKCRCLESDTTTDLQLDVLERATFGKDTIPTAEDLLRKYYEPSYTDNFPAIDSLCSQGMFQFTVADSHPIRGVQILQKLCQLYDEPKLYFVVPPHQFAAFKKQKFLSTNSSTNVGEIAGLKQYVLELPVIGIC